MFSRVLGVPLMLAAAVGVPYIASNGPNIDGLFPSSDATTEAANTSPANPHSPAMTPIATQLGPKSAIYSGATPLEGMASVSLQEVFNLNVTKEWVYQRWARKSTALSELGLFGVRVPLVTGTQMYDLAGSLTYYFDQAGRVNRISFHGTTADTSRLVQIVTKQFELRPTATPIAGEQLFQIRREQHVYSELRTRPASVLWSNSPHESFSVDLELQHPQATTPLPSRLAPLPVAAASQQPPPADANKKPESVDSDEKSDTQVAEAKKKDGESWKAFFPRSRVPNKQVNSLDRRSRMW